MLAPADCDLNRMVAMYKSNGSMIGLAVRRVCFTSINQGFDLPKLLFYFIKRNFLLWIRYDYVIFRA